MPYVPSISELFSSDRHPAQVEADLLAVPFFESDELSDLEWRPGFRQKRFMQGRKTACRLIAELLDGL